MDEVLKKVLSVVAKTAQEPAAGLDPDQMMGDLGLDSLDVVEIILDLEDAFPEADLSAFEPSLGSTCRDVANDVYELMRPL